MSLARVLLDLGADSVLVAAAYEGRVKELECTMPECLCPRGRGFFERVGGRHPWAPSPDHFPTPARKGGSKVPENIRLAHWKCNRNDWFRNPELAEDRRRAHQTPHARWNSASEVGLVKGQCGRQRLTTGECVCGLHDELVVLSGLMGI